MYLIDGPVLPAAPSRSRLCKLAPNKKMVMMNQALSLSLRAEGALPSSRQCIKIKKKKTMCYLPPTTPAQNNHASVPNPPKKNAGCATSLCAV